MLQVRYLRRLHSSSVHLLLFQALIGRILNRLCPWDYIFYNTSIQFGFQARSIYKHYSIFRAVAIWLHLDMVPLGMMYIPSGPACRRYPCLRNTVFGGVWISSRCTRLARPPLFFSDKTCTFVTWNITASLTVQCMLQSWSNQVILPLYLERHCAHVLVGPPSHLAGASHLPAAAQRARFTYCPGSVELLAIRATHSAHLFSFPLKPRSLSFFTKSGGSFLVDVYPAIPFSLF